MNMIVIIQAHPIPTFQRVIESFRGQSPAFMSLMDAQAGYLQVPVTEKSSKLLGIECSVGEAVAVGHSLLTGQCGCRLLHV